jgi:hypothetical protein
MADGLVMNVSNKFGYNLRVFARLMKTELSAEINRQCANVCYKAAEYTPFSTPSQINAEFQRAKVTRAKVLKTKGKGIKVYKPRNENSVVVYKIANWQRKIRKENPLGGIAMSEYARKLVNARIKSARFIRIGWSWCAEKFGKPFTRGDFGTKTMSRVGGAQLALPDSLEGIFMNRAGMYDIRYKPAQLRKESGAVVVERKYAPLARAIDAVQTNIQSEMEFRLQQLADKYNVKTAPRTFNV